MRTDPSSLFYGYDLSGNRTNMITLEGENAYAYDNRNWLTYAAYPDGSAQEFAYDPVGNRTLLSAFSATSVVETAYTYGPANRLLSSASALETNEYAYDGAGRLTNQLVNGQARRFAYNYRGQMTALHDKDGRVFAYDFDGDGNRIRQSLNDCLETRFVYDGPNVVLELTASNEVATAYINGLGIDQPIERIGFISAQPRFRHVFHADALGSIVALTDESGATVKTYAYEAFGRIRTETGAAPLNRITYTGREALGDSGGWYYYRSRVLNAHMGIFTSEDSKRFIDGTHLYQYAKRNPLRYRDPYGTIIEEQETASCMERCAEMARSVPCPSEFMKNCMLKCFENPNYIPNPDYSRPSRIIRPQGRDRPAKAGRYGAATFAARWPHRAASRLYLRTRPVPAGKAAYS